MLVYLAKNIEVYTKLPEFQVATAFRFLFSARVIGLSAVSGVFGLHCDAFC